MIIRGSFVRCYIYYTCLHESCFSELETGRKASLYCTGEDRWTL